MHPLSLILILAGSLLILRAGVRVYREGWSDPTIRVSFCCSLWLAVFLFAFRAAFTGGGLPSDGHLTHSIPVEERSFASGGE